VARLPPQERKGCGAHEPRPISAAPHSVLRALKVEQHFAERVLVFLAGVLRSGSRIFLGKVRLVPIFHCEHGMIGRREVLLEANGGDPALYRAL
jgi:hypothetical protein